MTPQEFSSLTPFEQEAFINADGTISPASVPSSLEVSDLASEVVQDAGMSVESFQSSVLGATSLQRDVLPEVSTGSSTSTQPTILSSSSTGPSDGEDCQTTTEGRERKSEVISRESTPITEEAEELCPPELVKWSEGFDIEDPVELLFLLDEDIKSGTTTLHPWQVEFMLDFAQQAHTAEKPFRAVVRAANGSGKDKYILAACIVWLCMRFNRAKGVATNGSGNQLSTQTEPSIRRLCEAANSLFTPDKKDGIWKCIERSYTCIPTKSPIILFATDEPNKAEGHHPIKKGGKMAIFTSESKAIPDEIFAALTRCNGFTHRVDVSSPGLPLGYFHDKCMNSFNRKELKSILDLPEGSRVEYHITAFECPHITPAEIKAFADDLPAGENDPVYQSGILAKFTTTDEMTVIPYSFVYWASHKAKTLVSWKEEQYNKAGLDLSDGGAETVLVVRNGNKHLKTIPFKFEDTQDTIDFLETKFEENGLTSKESLIFADCCGIGKPMIDSLRRRGWSNMRFVDSRHSSSNKKVYFNKGTELFFNVRQLLERKELIVEYDKLLVTQLTGRYYKLRDGIVRQLLTKLEQKSRGYPSPDRADAFNLAFWDYKSTRTFTDYSKEAPSEPYDSERIPEKPVSEFSLKTWAGGGKSSLDAFRKNVSKRQPINHLQRELERYNKR
jgi:hypothetical protein